MKIPNTTLSKMVISKYRVSGIEPTIKNKVAKIPITKCRFITFII